MCEWRWAASVDLVTVLWSRSRLGFRKLPVVSEAIGSKPVLIKGSGLGWREGGVLSHHCWVTHNTHACACTHRPQQPQKHIILYLLRDFSINTLRTTFYYELELYLKCFPPFHPDVSPVTLTHLCWYLAWYRALAKRQSCVQHLNGRPVDISCLDAISAGLVETFMPERVWILHKI